MTNRSIKTEKRIRRHARIRAKVCGTAEQPRLAVYRSNRALYVQLIDDARAVTLAAGDSRTITGANGRVRARTLGAQIATTALKLGITKAVFDRGGFLYAGSIRDLAEGAREAGLQF